MPTPEKIQKPEKREPTPCVRDLLAALYPTVRWEKVTFYEGLPGWVQRFTHGAITLPDPLGTHGIDVYVAAGQWNPCTPGGLGLLVHECFHVLQFQEGGAGLGALRVFTLKYLFRAIFEGGGRENRYEKPAYEQEEKIFIPACRKLPRPLCDCAAGTVDRAMLDQLLHEHPELVRRTAKAG